MLDPSVVLLDEPSMGLSPKVLRTVFDAARLMNAQGKTILLVEQNARAGLRLSARGVVLENGRVRLAGTGREILEHPEIGALYLGGAATGSPITGDAITGGAATGDTATGDTATGDPATGGGPGGTQPDRPAPGAIPGTAH
jgi:hypothetical protein